MGGRGEGRERVCVRGEGGALGENTLQQQQQQEKQEQPRAGLAARVGASLTLMLGRRTRETKAMHMEAPSTLFSTSDPVSSHATTTIPPSTPSTSWWGSARSPPHTRTAAAGPSAQPMRAAAARPRGSAAKARETSAPAQTPPRRRSWREGKK